MFCEYYIYSDGLFILNTQAVDVVADIFKDICQSLDAVKNVKHPEGIEEQEKDDDRRVNGLGHDGALKDGCSWDLVVGINDVEHIDEPEQENHEEDDLEKHEVKMAHKPFDRQIIPIPDFAHEIFVCHIVLLKGILSDSLTKAIDISNFWVERSYST